MDRCSTVPSAAASLSQDSTQCDRQKDSPLLSDRAQTPAEYVYIRDQYIYLNCHNAPA